MNDIVKLRELIGSGYFVKDVKIDSHGKGVITCSFSGKGKQVEGQVYYLITEDQLVLDRAKERLMEA